ncbi:MAG: sulfotransferase [Pseudomonadota bacterium]
MGVPVRHHPLARGKLADRASTFLGKAWDKGWLPNPPLDPEELWEIAARGLGNLARTAEEAGRPAEDIADFRLRLARLTTSINTEADLNPLGRAMAHGQLVRVIRNRLRFGELWNAQPAILTTELAPPIIVVGHMRSGTTRVHKLLAADPAHAATRCCDALHPVPTRPDLRYVKSAFDLAIMRRINPWLDIIHPMASGEVEEELSWLAAALNHSIYESQWRIPSYSAFSEARDPAPIYRELDRMLRTDAVHRGNADLPRVMKVPQFSEDLATLLAQFPDARLIIARRPSEEVHRSAVSLAANQMAIQSDTCDLADIEAFWWHKIALREKRMAAALSDWRGPVAQLQFAALNADWEREMRRCYAELGLDLTGQAIAAMRSEMASTAAGQHRAHSEQLARFAEQA